MNSYRSALPLEGINGNAFSVIAQVTRGLRQAGAPQEYIADVQAQMTSGDYDHLLQVALRYSDDSDRCVSSVVYSQMDIRGCDHYASDHDDGLCQLCPCQTYRTDGALE